MVLSKERHVARVSFSELRGSPVELQKAEGFVHTLGEIWQQPELWLDSARRVARASGPWRDVLKRSNSIVLTGSGSSYFVGRCIESSLQAQTGLPVTAIEAGELVLLGAAALPAARPLLLVSFARSGDSPESWGLVGHLLKEQSDVHHLVITCNAEGRLALRWGDEGDDPDPRVSVLTLDERSCDRSLVMTSSFTSLAIAGLGLGATGSAIVNYLAQVEAVAAAVDSMLRDALEPIEMFPVERAERMIAVGSGALHGAALEVSLKMLEMTNGHVLTRAETCLGLRHGPMCALLDSSLLFLPLSSNGRRRAYQIDLLKQVEQKRPGALKVLVGGEIPHELIAPDDLAIEIPGLRNLPDEWLAIASVVVGQLLAFRRCRAEGLCPDEPAVDDSITRVVRDFTLHGLELGAR